MIPPTTEGPGSFGESRPGERVGMGEEGGPHGDIPTKGFEPHE